MKTKSTAILLLLCLLATLVSCADGEKDMEKYTEYSFDYFDTVTCVTGYAESKQAFDETVADIFAQLKDYHRLFTIYHRYEGLENLCTVNEVKGGSHRTVKVDERIIGMLLYAKEMHTLTGGKLNIAMGSVLSLWHDYRTAGMDDPSTAELPPMDQLEEAAKHTDIDHLVIDVAASTVTITDPEMTLDVGAIAKGYAVEMIAQSLKAKGVTGFVLNVGGNVRTIGTKPDGSGFTVGIENPTDTEEPYIAYLSMTDESLVTSGSYQRYYLVDGKRYHHIIDSETLMPAEGFLSVSVLTAHSGLGDALSTALFCMSLEDGMALVASLPDTEAQWVTESGSIRVSLGWHGHTVRP